MAFAGGWIDQPFVSKLNPTPPGSMVVVGLKPDYRFMYRCGMATGTIKVANQLWGDRIPEGDPGKLVKELYNEENKDHPDEPSGSQDMIGLIYPGINRLDYDFKHEGGYFLIHIESNNDPKVAEWLEKVIHMMPVNQRPEGYNPFGDENMDIKWIRRLGQTGKDCFDAIINMDTQRLGESMNECMECWETIFPHVVKHSTLQKAGVDLVPILKHFQSKYSGAMYSGCGGGYLYIVSEEPIPGAFTIKVRIAE